MSLRTSRTTHLEPVMGTVVGISSPDPLPAAAVAAAVAVLHDADRVFSTWASGSPISRVRRGEATVAELDPADGAHVYEVLERCAVARRLTLGVFDPWAMPGGLDPTGLVKGWAVARALDALVAGGVRTAMVNAGGDIAVTGRPHGRPWRVAVRHPFEPDAFAAIVPVSGAIATSGEYERPGQLIDPVSGQAADSVASATVAGPELDLADAMATALAVAGPELLPAVEANPGYDAFVTLADGRAYATSGWRSLAATA